MPHFGVKQLWQFKLTWLISLY